MKTIALLAALLIVVLAHDNEFSYLNEIDTPRDVAAALDK